MIFQRNMTPIWVLFIIIISWVVVTNWNRAAPAEPAASPSFESIVFDSQKNSEIEPDSSQLVDYVRKNFIYPPAPVPYHLDETFAPDEGQHAAVLELLKNKTHGIFIESGAHDGQFLSTTIDLEINYGWTGLLVEPDAEVFQQLHSRRRRSWLANVCLSVKSIPMELKFIHNKKSIGENKLTDVDRVVRNEDTWAEEDKKYSTVKCVPFYTVLLALNMTEIDYLSLDIEGAELEVLKTVPFDKILFRTMTVENNHVRKIPGADEELKELLKSNGFIYVKDIIGPHSQDYLYAHHSIIN